jgi:ferric-dicitrate binding protein FerR (iron transport regulator)
VAETETETEAVAETETEPEEVEAEAETETAALTGDGVPIDEPAAEDDDTPASSYQPRRAAGISAGIAAGTLVMGTVLGLHGAHGAVGLRRAAL